MLRYVRGGGFFLVLCFEWGARWVVGIVCGLSWSQV